MKLVTIMNKGTGYSDGMPRYWATVIEDDGGPNLIARHAENRIPVAYMTQDHRSEAEAKKEAASYIGRHGN